MSHEARTGFTLIEPFDFALFEPKPEARPQSRRQSTLPVVRKRESNAFAPIELPIVRVRKAIGFTLIELLVVIAIIALLVSLLMPSLRQAKELARRAICGANLHHAGVAVFTYTNDYDGYIPPTWSHSDRMNYPVWTCMAYWAGGWPVMNGKRAYFNLAPLEFEGYVPTAKMLYCPSQRDYRWQWDFYSWTWEELTHQERLAQAVSVHMGYMFDPHNDGGRMRYKRLVELPPDRAMALDLLGGFQDGVAHRDAPGWQVLFADSHVEFKVVPDVYDLLPVGYYDHAPTLLSWALFPDYLRDIELQ